MNALNALVRMPARWLVPLMLAALALLASSVNYAVQIRSQKAALVQAAEQLLLERLSPEQHRLDVESGMGNSLLVGRLVTGLGLFQGLDQAYLVKADGQIAASLSRTDLGRPFSELTGQRQMLFQPLLGTNHPSIQTRYVSAQTRLLGSLPVQDGSRLLVSVDLSQALAEQVYVVRKNLLRESLVILSIAGVLALLLHTIWFRRAGQLAGSLGRMGSGDLSVRTGLQGRDELALIGAAADRMAERLQAEQAEIRHLNKLVHRSPLVVVEWRNESGWPVCFVSDSVVQWGYAPAELLDGKISYDDLIHPDDVQRINGDIALHVEHGPDDYRQEYRLRCKDGRWVWVDGRTALTRGPAGEVTGISGILLDITMQKEAQQERDRLVSILEATTDVVSMADPQGKVLYFNRSGQAVLNVKPDTPLAVAASHLHPQWASERILHEGLPSAIENGYWSGETALLDRDGREIPVSQIILSHRDERGNLLYLSTIMRDISARKTAESALREKEALLAEAQEVAHLGNWSLDLLSGEALWSAEEYRLLGYEPDAVEPTLAHFMQAVHPEDRDRVQSAMQQAMLPEGDRVYRVEHRVERPTGICHLEQRGRVSFDEHGSPARMFGTTMDVTERKRTEAALRQSEERYMLAARIGRSAAWEMWPLAGKVFSDVNFARLLGYEPEDLGEDLDHWMGTVPGDARASVEAAVQPVVEGRADSYEIEHPVRRKDGSIGWVLVQAQRVSAPDEVPLRLVGSSLDITERKLASQTLLDLKDMLEQAEVVSQLGSWAFDSDTGYLRWSPQMFRNMGMRWSQVPPSIDVYCERIHPDDVKPVRAAIDLLVRAQDVPTVVFRTNPAFGPVRWMRRTVHRIAREAEGKGPRYIGVLLDITQAREAEERLRHINQELERRVAERTEQLSVANRELEAFSYSVSHDLKAPLRGIDGYSQLLVDEYSDGLGDEGRQFVLNIRQGVRQMGELINDLLEYSRMERRDMAAEPLALRPLIEKILDGYHADIQKQGTQVRLSMEAFTLPLDREGISVVLRNLIGNALKFSREASEPAIEIGGRSEAGHRILWVRDNGVGFDMKYHDRIFGIFQRLHRSEEFPGTGVGLALVAKAVQRMGGRVWAESAPGAGATFYLEFPA